MDMCTCMWLVYLMRNDEEYLPFSIKSVVGQIVHSLSSCLLKLASVVLYEPDEVELNQI